MYALTAKNSNKFLSECTVGENYQEKICIQNIFSHYSF